MNIGLHNDVFAFKECGLRIVHLNINHLFPKLDQVKHISACYYNIDILAFTETFLNDRYLDQELEINGYKMFRIDRAFKGVGSILVYVDSLCAIPKHDINVEGVESLRFEVI